LRRYNQQRQHLFIELCRLKLIRFTLSTSCVKVSTRVTYSYRMFRLLINRSLLQLYRPENVYIVLVGMELWTRNGDWNSDASKRLTKFCSYRKNNINSWRNNDNALLLMYDWLLLSDSIAGAMFRDFAAHQLGFSRSACVPSLIVSRLSPFQCSIHQKTFRWPK